MKNKTNAILSYYTSQSLCVTFDFLSYTHKVSNKGINANFVFPYSYSFLHYLHLKMLVNVKLEVSL